MRRLALAALLAIATGCGTSPCQELGERICGCQPGATRDACKTQVQNQLKDIDPTKAEEDYCQERLDLCTAPAESDFCEWLLTPDAKTACGLTPASAPPAP